MEIILRTRAGTPSLGHIKVKIKRGNEMFFSLGRRGELNQILDRIANRSLNNRQQNKPTLILFAGIPAAGKSTIMDPFIEKHGDKVDDIVHPNEIFYGIEAENEDEKFNRAVDELNKRTKRCLENKQSFITEASDEKNGLDIIKEAKKQGFEVLYFQVILDSEQEHYKRIQTRVQQGKHDIPDDWIKSKYNDSIENATKALEESDYGWIIDNTKKHTPILETFHGKIKRKSRRIPPIVRSKVIESLKTKDREKQKEKALKSRRINPFSGKDVMRKIKSQVHNRNEDRR